MSRRKYTDEYLINGLKELGLSLGRTPRVEDLKICDSLPKHKTFAKYFGSWNNALLKSGFELNMIREFSKENVVESVMEFYQKHNRSPYYNEIKYKSSIIRKFWSSWEDMLKELNLPPNRNMHDLKTKEDGIKFIKDLYDKTNKIPTATYIEKEYGINKNWFLFKFGNFNNALYESGLVGVEYTYGKERLMEESINRLIELYNKIGKAPTASQYDEIVKGTPFLNRKALESNVGKRFAEICKEYIGEANQLKKSKELLLKELIDLKEKLGRTPMIKDLTENGLSEFKQYTRAFNKPFSEMLEDLGWELDYVRPKHKSDEELLADYKNLYDKLNRIPLREDLNNEESVCNYATYKNRFGDLRVVWDTLDIDYAEDLASHSLGMGYTCIDNNGDVCRSYSEMIITNYLIDNQIKYIKEYPYSELIITDKTKKRFDWYLPNSNICIEYFGLFDEKYIHHDTWVGKYSRKVLEKIKICEENNVNLISIYPEDINEFNKYKEKIKSSIKLIEVS